MPAWPATIGFAVIEPSRDILGHPKFGTSTIAGQHQSCGGIVLRAASCNREREHVEPDISAYATKRYCPGDRLKVFNQNLAGDPFKGNSPELRFNEPELSEVILAGVKGEALKGARHSHRCIARGLIEIAPIADGAISGGRPAANLAARLCAGIGLVVQGFSLF